MAEKLFQKPKAGCKHRAWDRDNEKAPGCAGLRPDNGRQIDVADEFENAADDGLGL